MFKINKIIIRSMLCSLLFLIFSGCNDPVFYEVSTQVKSPLPTIKGSPTDFASIKQGDGEQEFEVVYVASGSAIHIYYENSDNQWIWARTDPSLGRITYLAATDTKLFILTPSGVHVSTPAGEPNTANHLNFSTPITSSEYRFITMYSANNEIFSGVINNTGTSYSIFNITSSTAEEVTGTNNGHGLLNGVAFNGSSYYFSVKDQVLRNAGGIYKGTTSDADLIEDDSGNNYSIPFMGIISIENNVIAIARSGVLYDADTLETLKNPNTGSNISTGRTSNGVLSIVKSYDGEKWDGARLLLAGRQDALTYDVYSGYTYGYLEIELEGDNIKLDGAFREPGITGSTVANVPSTLQRDRGSNDTFRTTIGTYALRFIFQANDDNKTIFASTHQNGVWSLRHQNDRSKNYPYWNTEH